MRLIWEKFYFNFSYKLTNWGQCFLTAFERTNWALFTPSHCIKKRSSPLESVAPMILSGLFFAKISSASKSVNVLMLSEGGTLDELDLVDFSTGVELLLLEWPRVFLDFVGFSASSSAVSEWLALTSFSLSLSTDLLDLASSSSLLPRFEPRRFYFGMNYLRCIFNSK